MDLPSIHRNYSPRLSNIADILVSHLAQVKGGGGSSQEEKESGFGRLFLCLSLARARRCDGEAAAGTKSSLAQ